MALSKEMRLLAKKWAVGTHWPKRLEAIEVSGLRGWSGQRVDFPFPIVALVGENGAGKSTILQAAASVYKGGAKRFASTFFPDTPWEKVQRAAIKWQVREGATTREGSIRKETTRWRGNPERRERPVEYIDLSRILPVIARVGYSRLAKPQHREASAVSFDQERLKRLSSIMNRNYGLAKMSLTDFDNKRSVPVINHHSASYSGFHGGAGETTMVEFLRTDFPAYGLVIIDEIETSLHPRSQRRLMRDLAEICRVKETQLIISTHSPYVLEELPESARLYIWEGASGREVIKGVSPQFAMTKMDLEQHPECDVYVEDEVAKTMLREIVVAKKPDIIPRCLIVPYGAASVGEALGQMNSKNRFPRPTCVFIDGDQAPSGGCVVLPGGDAPERVIFEAMRGQSWSGVASRIGRSASEVIDHCNRAMSADDHHDWIRLAADELVVGGDHLWQVLCAVWATQILSAADAKPIIDELEAKLP